MGRLGGVAMPGTAPSDIGRGLGKQEDWILFAVSSKIGNGEFSEGRIGSAAPQIEIGFR